MNNSKSWIKIVVFILIVLLYYFPSYGLTFPPCNQREHKGLPNDPQNLEFNFKSDDLMSVRQETGCSPTLKTSEGNIGMEIIPGKIHVKDNQINYRITKTFYTRYFGLTGALNSTSGPSWSKYFLVEDPSGHSYATGCWNLELGSTIDSSLINCDSKP